MELSEIEDIIFFPHGLNETVLAEYKYVLELIKFNLSPVTAFQNMIYPSSPHDTNRLPSGLMSTQLTMSLCPLSILDSCVSMFHIRTVISWLDDTMNLLFG